MNEFKVVWNVIIRGKADLMLDLIRQNFAMAWMLLTLVENFCRADGGVGIMLYDLGHRFRYDAVYGIQILILLTGAGSDFLLRKCREWVYPYSVLKLEKK
jgi:NitT/TauT family transport system permease protein